MFQKFGKDVPQSLVDAVSGIMSEAKADEPAKPDAEAIARRKRLQAIKDKQEDDAAERGTGEKKSSAVRQVAGKAYGGAKQKDDKEDMEEGYGCATKKEELIGGQKKLDKNHNGKLDADDFKRLRKEDALDEKAVSIAQQKFMGMVNAVKKGKMKAPSAEVSKAASSMTKKAAHDYAATKHKGLPQHKEEAEELDEVDMSTLNHLASHPMAGAAVGAAGAAVGTAIAHGVKKTVDYLNKKKSEKQFAKEEVEQVVEYAGQPKDVPFDADKPHAPVAKAGKSGYGASAAKHLAKQGLKKFLKKEMLGKAPANEETEIEESRGHKILATKLKQLDTKLDKMSSGIAPDTHTNPQSTADKIKDAANINSVEIVKQKDTSVKKEDVNLVENDSAHGFHANVEKELKKHSGKIGSVVHNKKDNAIAAVVHHTDDNGLSGPHHVHFFFNDKKVHSTVHPTFADASQHAVDTITSKKGLKHLGKMHSLMEENQINEISKKTLGSYINKATKDAQDWKETGHRYETDPDEKAFAPAAHAKSASRVAGVKKAFDKMAKEEVELQETATLDQYIKSMGYDPMHMEKNKKVMFSKTNAFKAYAARSEGASPGQETDTGDSLNQNATARG